MGREDIPKHEIHSSDNCDCVSKEVVTHYEVRASKVGETRSTDFTTIRAIRAVTVRTIAESQTKEEGAKSGVKLLTRLDIHPFRL